MSVEVASVEQEQEQEHANAVGWKSPPMVADVVMLNKATGVHQSRGSSEGEHRSNEADPASSVQGCGRMRHRPALVPERGHASSCRTEVEGERYRQNAAGGKNRWYRIAGWGSVRRRAVGGSGLGESRSRWWRDTF